MSIAPNEGIKIGDDSIYALSKEGLSVSLDITVLYRLSQEKAPMLFKEIGQNYSEVIVRPEIRSAIREVVANYDVKEIYSAKRAEANQKLTDLLKSKVEPRGIMIEEVLLRNVQLPKNLADSIELKLQSEQEAQRYDFILEQETKEAERKRIEAAGQRDSQKIISEGLTPSYLQYLYITSLRDRQGTIYVPTNPSNGLPTFKGL
jgi:regulator of protease activity HflC (stomatin/prohibitin superfamily)